MGILGDICAAQIHALYEHGVDVHLAMPNYLNVVKINANRMSEVDIRSHRHEMPENRIHLAQDRSFYKYCPPPPTTQTACATTTWSCLFLTVT